MDVHSCKVYSRFVPPFMDQLYVGRWSLRFIKAIHIQYIYLCVFSSLTKIFRTIWGGRAVWLVTGHPMWLVSCSDAKSCHQQCRIAFPARYRKCFFRETLWYHQTILAILEMLSVLATVTEFMWKDKDSLGQRQKILYEKMHVCMTGSSWGSPMQTRDRVNYLFKS